MEVTVELHFYLNGDNKQIAVDIPAEYVTTDWAVHRPATYNGSRASLNDKGWRVTDRHSGRQAWAGTNLNEAKKIAKTLQAVSDMHGALTDDLTPERRTELLRLHAEALGLKQKVHTTITYEKEEAA